MNYSGESNVVNRGTLDFSTIGVAGTHKKYPDNLYVKGYNPWNLPRTVTTRSGLEQKTTVSVSDDRWLMPFDFGAEAEGEINVARCETNCKLDIPPSGTVIVSNATLSATAAYPRHWTEYPILTCQCDGETVFADWTVQTAGEWGHVQVQKVVKSTGLYVRIREPQGILLIFR